MKKQLFMLGLAIFTLASNLFAQPERWQQHIDYKIKAALDVTTNIIKGTE